MTNIPKTIYSDIFNTAITEICHEIPSSIIVIYGDILSIDITGFRELIVDNDTFFSLGGHDVFDKKWFSQLFTKLSVSNSVSVLSYPQFVYLTSYISLDFFAERVVIIEDNLRRYFPIGIKDFIFDTQENDEDLTDLPLYQADQLKVDNCYYYSSKTPDKDYGQIRPLFNKYKPLAKSATTPYDAYFIDPFSDSNELDILIDGIISGRCNKTQFYVKFYNKQPTDEETTRKLQSVNYLLSLVGREILIVVEDVITVDFTPSNQLDTLLKKYWGQNAEFRTICLYKNPNISSETINISQGKVVQTLIDEYENVCAGREYRDVFLTAPTGAGKSLLFQLPAFYISSKGDVTIVVSPLIALMKDQVGAIKRDRKFEKVAYLNSEISFLDRESIIEKCKNNEIDILYMAPELLMSYDIRYFIGSRKIGLIVIDEAHLITTWGRDFRVDYWYIGNHIRKIRKYSEQEFPMIALTATAVFGGDKNDMVFDTVDSLVMHSPHYFIGVVKRDDIDFLISNYDAPEKGFDNNKLKQTVNFIKGVDNLGFKTLVYAPYTEQVKKLCMLANEGEEIAVQYYGSSLDSLSKEQSERQFRRNQRKVMVCTKAFGMGVDIPDIQVVYHHAPSGLLPDYVQEIGRAARIPGMNGYAAMNYCQRDQKYSNQLYGMSALKLWQLKAILKKLYTTYLHNGKKRNMLVSVDDFAYAFEDAQDIEQKVKTALMMIEKNYLMKYRFNVVIARPKQLFTKVYSRVSAESLCIMGSIYSDCFVEISKHVDGSAVIIIDLNKLWQKYFDNCRFPVLKRQYYTGELFSELDVQPRLKLSFVFNDKSTTINTIKNLFECLTKFFISTDYKYFDKDSLIDALKSQYNDRTSRQIASFVLSSYSGEKKVLGGGIEENAFLQEIKTTPRQYRVFGNRYEGSFAYTLSLLPKLMDNDNKEVIRYVSKENSVPYIRIGHLLEILDIGSYEMRGGESPMIFVRLNSPETVRKDSSRTDYTNILFEKTQEKHKVSTEIMNYFFTHGYTSEERWNFIEDFFLGENNEELIRKYPGTEIKRFDIIDCLKHKEVQNRKTISDKKMSSDSMTYPPRSGKYMPKDHLTIEINGNNVTRTIQGWIDEDPVSLYKVIQAKIIYVDSGVVFKRLKNAIKDHNPDEYSKILGINKVIQIPGYSEPITAGMAMKEDPVKFYKWWSVNRQEVFIPLKEKIWLLDRVFQISPSVLKMVDRKILESGVSNR